MFLESEIMDGTFYMGEVCRTSRKQSALNEGFAGKEVSIEFFQQGRKTPENWRDLREIDFPEFCVGVQSERRGGGTTDNSTT